MGRFYEVPAAFLIACILTLLCYLVWQLLPPARALRAAAVGAVTAFIAFMIVWPKVHLFYPLGVDDWGEKNFRVAALEEIKQREGEPFRVASVLPLQPAYAYAQGLECADGWANLFPAVYRDLWLRVQAPLFARLPLVKNVFDPDTGKPQDNYIFLGTGLVQPGVGQLPGEDTRRCLRDGFDLRPRFNLDLLRLLNVKYLLSEYPLRAPGLELVHAPAVPPAAPQFRDYATGLLYGERPPGSPRKPGPFGAARKALADGLQAARRKRRGKDVFVYELTGSLPRWRFVREVVVEPDAKAALDRLASFDAERHRCCAVLEAEDAAPLAGRRQFCPGTVRLTKYASDEIDLAIDNEGPGLLVIGNTWDPHWRAEVDGEPRPLVRVNHAQFAVLTGPGASRIRLVYAPPYSPARLLGHVSLDGPITAFGAFLALHLLAYVLVARHRPCFQRERGIFLYHAVPAAVAVACAVGLAVARPGPAGLCRLLIAISLQGIYSLSFLELWSLSQGGYSLTILSRLAAAGGAASALGPLEQVGAGKRAGRVAGLLRLRLIRAQGDRFTLTRPGRLVARALRCVRRMANLNQLG
jgi:hypothetical protein